MRIKFYFDFDDKIEDYEFEWGYPVLPRIGEIIWHAHIMFKDIENIPIEKLNEDQEIRIKDIFWEQDKDGVYPFFLFTR